VPRLHVVTGKGGTGKTTVAGALALSLASGGKRILLVEIEGRQGLAQVFDTAPLPYTETRLAATQGGEVIGVAVDAEQAMLEYLDMFYSMKRAGGVLRRMGGIDFVTTIAPGLRDVLLTGKVKEAVTRVRDGHQVFDAVVLDAPPTGRIVSFLQATNEVAGLTKFGPIHRQSAGVAELLHSDLTVVHLVSLAEEMPVQETIEGIEHLCAAGYRVGAIFLNRCRADVVPARWRSTIEKMDTSTLVSGLVRAEIDPALAPLLLRQAAEFAEHQEVQRTSATQLSDTGAPIILLSELTPPINLGSLHELADEIDTTIDEICSERR
jgi:anion-transporting  ArsA/GET3 family ATPase